MSSRELHGRLQLVGEIETPVVPSPGTTILPGAGEQVFFASEPSGSPRSIRVEDGQGELLGYLPHSLAKWLGELLRADRVQLSGYRPTGSQPTDAKTEPRLRVRLSVFFTPAGLAILRPRRPRTKAEALHEVVRVAYEQVQQYAQAKLVMELAEGLRPLECQALLPPTRLLLALLPSIAREIQKVEALQEQVAGRDDPGRRSFLRSNLAQVTL